MLCYPDDVMGVVRLSSMTTRAGSFLSFDLAGLFLSFDLAGSFVSFDLRTGRPLFLIFFLAGRHGALLRPG